MRRRIEWLAQKAAEGETRALNKPLEWLSKKVPTLSLSKQSDPYEISIREVRGRYNR